MSDKKSDKKPDNKPDKNPNPKKIELQPTILEKGDTFRRYMDEFFEGSFIEKVLPTGKK